MDVFNLKSNNPNDEISQLSKYLNSTTSTKTCFICRLFPNILLFVGSWRQWKNTCTVGEVRKWIQGSINSLFNLNIITDREIRSISGVCFVWRPCHSSGRGTRCSGKSLCDLEIAIAGFPHSDQDKNSLCFPCSQLFPCVCFRGGGGQNKIKFQYWLAPPRRDIL